MCWPNGKTFLQSYEGVASRGTELDAFIGCHAAADANNRQLHGLEAELSSLGPQRARIAMALQLGLQAASPEQLAECLTASPELERIGYWLSDQRTLASLRLPRDQELLAVELDVDGLHAWGRLYDRLSGALRISVMEQGELVERSPGQIQFDSADRTVRQNNLLCFGEGLAECLRHLFRCAEPHRRNATDQVQTPWTAGPPLGPVAFQPDGATDARSNVVCRRRPQGHSAGLSLVQVPSPWTRPSLLVRPAGSAADHPGRNRPTLTTTPPAN